MNRFTSLLPTLLLSWLAMTLTVLPSTVPAAEADLDGKNGRLLMNMRDADIRALIQWVADQTGRNIIVHRDVQGTVNVVSSQPLSPDEAYEVFLSVLQVNGYAAVQTPEALKIVPATIATQSGVPLASQGGDLVVQVVKVQNVTATALADMLKPLMSSNGVITPHPATNTLVIADHRQQLGTLQQLIQRLDQVADADIEVLPLQHANARDVLQSLTALYPPGHREAGAEVQLSFDERSNSILVGGDAVRRKQIRQLVHRLDGPLVGDGHAQVIYLHYIDAAEVAPILKSLATSIQKAQKDESASISIESSKTANALVINAPPALQGSLRRVIEQLDIRRAQVLVEAMVVEISGDVAEDIGVSWMSADLQDLEDSSMVGAVNTLRNLGTGRLVRDDSGNVLGYEPGAGVTLGYFNKGNLQAALRALKSTTRANVLSTPTVVAIDNEEASLLVGQNVPFITGESTGAASSTENPFTTIERKDIGVELIVTPRINQGDSITLDIKQTVENVAPSVERASDLITNKREIITKALVKDGQILVLGGLISDDQSEFEERVPVLGKLPIVGALFRGKGTSRSKKNLMVFIHPVILKDEEHIADITQRRYQFMRELQQEWNQPRGQQRAIAPNILPEFDHYQPGGKP